LEASSEPHKLELSVQTSCLPREFTLTRAQNFEKDLTKNRKDLGAQLKKLEQEAQKAGKKGDHVLKTAMKNFNDKREEIDRFKSDNLRKIFLLERKRFGDVLTATSKLAQSQMDYAAQVASMSSDASNWQSLLGTIDNLTDDQINALASKADKPFVQLRQAEAGDVVLYESTNAIITKGAASASSGPPCTP